MTNDNDDIMAKIIAGLLVLPLTFILAFGFYLIFAPISALIFAYPIMLVWNAVIPKVFGLVEIGFWDAFALDLVVTWLGLRKMFIK